MAIVGSAYVIVRAISKSLERDITKGVQDAVKNVLPAIDKATADIDKTVSKNVKGSITRATSDFDEEAADAGRRTGIAFAKGFPDLGQTIRKKVNTAFSGIGSEALPIADSAGKKVANAFADSYGLNLTKGIRGRINDAIIPDGRHILPNVRALGHELGTEFAESFVVEIPQTIEKRVGFIRRAVNTSVNKAWQQVRADKGGKDLGNKFIKGFVGAISDFKIPPIVWIGFFGIGAVGGIIKILASYVASAISLLSALGPAVAGAGIAAAAGVAVLGTTVGAVMLALKTKTKDLEKFQKILKDTGKEFQVVGVAVQKQLLPRLSDALDIITKLIPTLKTGLAPVGKAVGDVAIQLAKVATNKGNLESLNGIFKATPGIIKPLGSALGSILTIFLDLAQAGAPLLQQFVSFVDVWLKGKQAALDQAEASGKLADSVKKMERVGKQVGRILGNVARGIGGIFKAASVSGQDILDSIETITKRFDNFINAPVNQSKIQKFFTNSRDIMREVNGLLGDMLVAIGKPIGSGGKDNIITFIRTIRKDLLPAFVTIAQEAAKLAPKLVPLFQSIADLVKRLSETGALGKFFDTLTKIVDLLVKLFNIPIVGDLLGWSLGFLGVFKAVNFVLKPIGGLNTILGPLGKLLFGTKTNAGLLSKAFDAVFKSGDAVGGKTGPLAKITEGVKGLGSKLWTGAATAVKTGFKGVLTAVGGLGKGLAAAVDGMLSGASKLIGWTKLIAANTAKTIATAIGKVLTAAGLSVPWGNLTKGAPEAVAKSPGATGIAPAFGAALKKPGIWTKAFAGLGSFILGPLAAALTIVEIGHLFVPLADQIASQLVKDLPGPIAKGFQTVWTVVNQHPIIRDIRLGVGGVLDNLWPDKWPWEDDPPPAPDFSKVTGELDKAKTAIQTAASDILGAVSTSKFAQQLELGFAVADSKTGGALSTLAGTVKTQGQTVVTETGKVVSGIVGAFRTGFVDGKPKIEAQVAAMLVGVAGVVSTTLGPMVGATQTAVNNVRIALQSARNAVGVAAREMAADVAPTVQTAVNKLKGIGATGPSSFASGMRSQITKVQAAANAMGAAAVVRTSTLAGRMFSAGAAVMASFVAGLRSKFQAIASAAIAAANTVIRNKGPIEKDRVMLIPQGIATMEGYIKGLEKGYTPIEKSLRAFTASIPDLVAPADPAGELTKKLQAVAAKVKAFAPHIDLRDEALAMAAPGTPGTRPALAPQFTFNTYNPVEEKTSQTVIKASTKVARTGAFA